MYDAVSHYVDRYNPVLQDGGYFISSRAVVDMSNGAVVARNTRIENFHVSFNPGKPKYAVSVSLNFWPSASSKSAQIQVFFANCIKSPRGNLNFFSVRLSVGPRLPHTLYIYIFIYFFSKYIYIYIYIGGRQTDRQKFKFQGGMSPGVLDPPEHNLMGDRWNGWLEHGILDVHNHLHLKKRVPDTGQRDTFQLGSPVGFCTCTSSTRFRLRMKFQCTSVLCTGLLSTASKACRG